MQVPVCYLMDFRNQDWSLFFSQMWVPQIFLFYLLYKMASIKLSHQYLIENVSFVYFFSCHIDIAVWIDQMINFIPIFTLQLLWEKEVFGGNNYLVNEQIMVKDCNLLPFLLFDYQLKSFKIYNSNLSKWPIPFCHSVGNDEIILTGFMVNGKHLV